MCRVAPGPPPVLAAGGCYFFFLEQGGRRGEEEAFLWIAQQKKIGIFPQCCKVSLNVLHSGTVTPRAVALTGDLTVPIALGNALKPSCTRRGRASSRRSCRI